MACFIVPGAEAIVTTVITKVVENYEKKNGADGSVHVDKIQLSSHLKRLNVMLCGGSALLAFEHLWHGEISPVFPFLTAMESAEETAQMFMEMSTVGVAMAILVTLTWAGTVVVTNKLYKRDQRIIKEVN